MLMCPSVSRLQVKMSVVPLLLATLRPNEVTAGIAAPVLVRDTVKTARAGGAKDLKIARVCVHTVEATIRAGQGKRLGGGRQDQDTMTQVVTDKQVGEAPAASSVDVDGGMGGSLSPATSRPARVMHPNSLANLRPISPEHRANGRSHGASVLEWINRLDVPGMSLVKLRAIAADEEAPPSKRKAAQSHLRSLQMEHAKNGRPLAYDDLTLQLDYTHGKPTQRVEVTKREIADPRAMTLDLLHMLAEHPELRVALANELAGLLPGAGANADNQAVGLSDGAGSPDAPQAPNSGSSGGVI